MQFFRSLVYIGHRQSWSPSRPSDKEAQPKGRSQHILTLNPDALEGLLLTLIRVQVPRFLYEELLAWFGPSASISLWVRVQHEGRGVVHDFGTAQAPYKIAGPDLMSRGLLIGPKYGPIPSRNLEDGFLVCK